MSMFVAASWDTQRIFSSDDDWTVTVVRNSNTTAVVLTGSFFGPISGTIEDIDYKSAIGTLVNELNSRADGDWSGKFDPSTKKYNLACTLGHTRTYGAQIKKVFGFKDVTTLSTTQTSFKTPFYLWFSNEDGYTKYSEEMEVELPFEERIADDGRAFGLSHGDSSVFNAGTRGNFNRLEWTWTNEPQKNVWSRLSSSLTPYVWEAHVQHVRSFYPWCLFLSSTASSVVYEDREATCKTVGRDARMFGTQTLRHYYGFYDIEVSVRQLSRGTDFGQQEEIEIGVD